MSLEKSVFGVLPMNVLTKALIRRLQPANSGEGETVLIEKHLLDALISIVEHAQRLYMADEPLRRRNITIEGGKNQFTCQMDYLTEKGDRFVKVQGEGHSVLDAFLAATASFNAKLDEMVR